MPVRGHRHFVADQSFRKHLAIAVDQLVAEFKPDKIILFGSLAHGHARPESSVDVLIISEMAQSMRFLERIKRAIKVSQDEVPTLTPLVYTPSELSLLSSQGDGFISEILSDGKVLYQQPVATKKKS